MHDSGSILTVGQIVPGYELLRCIGRGAYGEVWLARSKATGVLRAPKILWRHKFDDDRPFQREFEGIQRFERISREHPSQLALFHIGRYEAEGFFYYVMELADNLATVDDYAPRTLRADLTHGRLPAVRALEIGLALSKALSHLHGNGLVHRDVKPSNVIFVHERPKLADIGLVTEASDSRSIVGTEGYLPPEGPGTPQADIFALGKLLYESITGLDRRNFPSLPPEMKNWKDVAAVMELNQVILRCCEPNLTRRYAKCDEVCADLVMIQEGRSLRHKRIRRQAWSIGKQTALVLAVVAAVVFMSTVVARRKDGPPASSDGPDSPNIEARALCDKAMYILRGDNYRELGAAYTNFHDAIKLDPNFVRPYVGLLEFRVREHVIVPGLPDYTQEIRSIAKRLETLAPHLAATLCARSIVHWADRKYPAALRRIEEALTADPRYELSRSWDAWMLVCLGRPVEAREQVETERQLFTFQNISYRGLGNAEMAARHYAEAIHWYRKAIASEPHHSVPYYEIGRACQAMGDYTESLDYLRQHEILNGANEAKVNYKYQVLRQAFQSEGPQGYWEQLWNWSEAKTNPEFYYKTECYWKAVIQIHLGHTNEAFHWLQASYDRGEGFGEVDAPLSNILYDEYWDGVRNDPRFMTLLDQFGFTKVMSPKKL